MFRVHAFANGVRKGGGREDACVPVYILMPRVGQNRIHTPFMTVYMVISLPKIPYTHRIYMVLANPTPASLHV